MSELEDQVCRIRNNGSSNKTVSKKTYESEMREIRAFLKKNPKVKISDISEIRVDFDGIYRAY